MVKVKTGSLPGTDSRVQRHCHVLLLLIMRRTSPYRYHSSPLSSLLLSLPLQKMERAKQSIHAKRKAKAGFALLWRLIFVVVTAFLLVLHKRLIRHGVQVRQPHALVEPSMMQGRSVRSPASKRGAGCQCVLCDSDPECGGLWKADAVGGNAREFKHIHFVIAHCNHTLDWLMKFSRDFQDLNIQSTIISKCGKEGATEIDEALTVPTIVSAPNVGGCDHSYAHWLHLLVQGKVPQLSDSTDVIVFLKDTDRVAANIHQPGKFRTLEEMLRITSQTGFSCGMEPTKPGWHTKNKKPAVISAYHDTSILQKFVLKRYGRWKSGLNNTEKAKGFKSDFKDLGEYHDVLQINMPQNLTQVCYGGSFSVSMKAIQRQPAEVWAKLEMSLSRGNNIEESHFVERTWAALLATPLTNVTHIASLRKFSTSIIERKGSIMGALQKEMWGD